ncbi:toll/interleukin-1 receptor domain-containing protein [Colwellia sp. PAMC 21821]|uniref:toll/interleukin-1 receptor domain-containing protein n=1 Tax=Colwellia sp. PAMC 21821 TaxID=1816219 RepID=UPI0009BDEFFC|nr:toll/interleukin-1 receptor domain-containing protein [Colwellia sp. PAMC 21821]ARD45293.1 hypothetical protein A3Q33_13910 [Colwellia sp. PAMC 21821]
MTNDKKISLLQKLIEKSVAVTVESSSDPEFKSWKNLVERTLIKVFGKKSTEFEQFSALTFHYRVFIVTSSSDYTSDHLRVFKQDFKMLITSIYQYLEEMMEEKPEIIEPLNDEKPLTKVFISHASADADVVEEVVELLETIGLESNQIFCTSFEGYGIDLGENFLDKIKEELSSDSLVIFILSENFYKSPVCLCEMGATWVLAKEHIPMIIPPLDYSDVKGVIPLSQGLKINETLKLNSLKDKIENDFSLSNSMSSSTWERKRDRIVARIEKHLSSILA